MRVIVFLWRAFFSIFLFLTGWEFGLIPFIASMPVYAASCTKTMVSNVSKSRNYKPESASCLDHSKCNPSHSVIKFEIAIHGKDLIKTHMDN